MPAPDAIATPHPLKSAVAGFLRSGVTHVLFAFFAMGAWALYANADHGPVDAFRAAMIQGAASAMITALMKRGLETLFARMAPGAAARLLPPTLVCAVSASALVLFHWLSGTPDIGQTVALPLSVSTSYAFFYTLTLRRP